MGTQEADTQPGSQLPLGQLSALTFPPRCPCEGTEGVQGGGLGEAQGTVASGALRPPSFLLSFGFPSGATSPVTLLPSVGRG